jgi:hypothetical protein
VCFGEGDETSMPAACAPQILRSEFLLDQSLQMIAYRRVIEPLYYFVQKTGYDEALGDGNGYAPGTQIKEFVLVDLTPRWRRAT